MYLGNNLSRAWYSSSESNTFNTCLLLHNQQLPLVALYQAVCAIDSLLHNDACQHQMQLTLRIASRSPMQLFFLLQTPRPISHTAQCHRLAQEMQPAYTCRHSDFATWMPMVQLPPARHHVRLRAVSRVRVHSVPCCHCRVLGCCHCLVLGCYTTMGPWLF